MRRNLGTILLTSVALVSAACDESPTGLARGDNQVRQIGLRVQIEGPAVVQAPGEYEWTARVVGAADEALTYEWSVFDMGGSREIIKSTEPVLTLSLDPAEIGNLQIELVVRTSTDRAFTSEIVGVCASDVDWCIPHAEVAGGR